MDFNHQTIKALIQFVEAHPYGTGVHLGQYTRLEIGDVKRLVRRLLEYERENIPDVPIAQANFFNFLVQLAGGEDARAGAIGKLILVKWAQKSQSAYAIAYRIGHSHGHIDGSRNTLIRIGSRQKKRIAEAGMKGAEAKHRPIAELKKWALEQAKKMRGSDMDVARRLSSLVPGHLADASKDPQRLIYDAIRSERTRTAS